MRNRTGEGVVAVAAAGVALLATACAAATVGYRGDGTCVARDGVPPVRFGGDTGSNVLWTTLLPNWSLASPAVAGGRVFVTSEPDRDHDFPLLIGLDADSGRVLWERELDPFAGVEPAARPAEALKAWHESLDALRSLYRARYVYYSATNKAEVVPQLEAQGFGVDSKRGLGWAGKDNRPDVGLARVFNRAGLYFDVWHLGGLGRIGYAYPTPVTDGRRVYVATAQHSFHCFEADTGKPVWQRFHRGQGSSNAGYGGDDFCKHARSPLLYTPPGAAAPTLMIADVGNVVRAIDTATGDLVWSDKHPGHEVVSPVVARVGRRDVLLTYGPAAYLLPDGARLRIDGWGNNGGTMLVKSDEPDVVFFTGGGEHGGWENKGNCSNPPPAAVRFALEQPAAGAAATNAPQAVLRATVLWSGIASRSSGECHAGIVYAGGKLYHPGGCILDAATGRTLAGKHRDRYARATPQTRHLTWVAGEYVFGLKDTDRRSRDDGTPGGLCEVYTLDGRKVAENWLPVAKPDAARRDRIVEAVGAPGWGFSYGCPFTLAGGRIYMRTHDGVICVGAR